MATITARETQRIDEANASGRIPVVFIHGLWLLPSSWDRWATVFEEAGYATVAPDWPDDPETVEEARANPGVCRCSQTPPTGAALLGSHSISSGTGGPTP
jgi:hypothetical protein